MMFFVKIVFGQKVFFSTGDWVSWKKVVKKREGDHIFVGICRCVVKVVILSLGNQLLL